MAVVGIKAEEYLKVILDEILAIFEVFIFRNSALNS